MSQESNTAWLTVLNSSLHHVADSWLDLREKLATVETGDSVSKDAAQQQVLKWVAEAEQKIANMITDVEDDMRYEEMCAVEQAEIDTQGWSGQPMFKVL